MEWAAWAALLTNLLGEDLDSEKHLQDAFQSILPSQESTKQVIAWYSTQLNQIGAA